MLVLAVAVARHASEVHQTRLSAGWSGTPTQPETTGLLLVAVSASMYPITHSFAGVHLLLLCICCGPARRAKKLTEYEKWEYKQLAMSGVLDVREFPLFDEENGLGVLAQVDEVGVVGTYVGQKAFYAGIYSFAVPLRQWHQHLLCVDH